MRAVNPQLWSLPALGARPNPPGAAFTPAALPTEGKTGLGYCVPFWLAPHSPCLHSSSAPHAGAPPPQPRLRDPPSGGCGAFPPFLPQVQPQLPPSRPARPPRALLAPSLLGQGGLREGGMKGESRCVPLASLFLVRRGLGGGRKWLYPPPRLPTAPSALPPPAATLPLSAHPSGEDAEPRRSIKGPPGR